MNAAIRGFYESSPRIVLINPRLCALPQNCLLQPKQYDVGHIHYTTMWDCVLHHECQRRTTTIFFKVGKRSLRSTNLVRSICNDELRYRERLFWQYNRVDADGFA